MLEAEMRQPLLQGAGAQFNRIAGPGAVPGAYNGVLIARTNTDISLADFELGMRNFVNDVETAYWELYFAYHDLDTKIAARNQSLHTWRILSTWGEEGRLGGEPEKVAQAREQYYRLEEEVQNAVSGRYEDRIRLTAFRGIGGVQTTERRLRLLMGVPLTDGRLIRPAQEPRMAKVVFQWDEALDEALTRREELRRQRWLVKRRELELLASRNFLYPQLDAVGRYRWRGFGRDLLDSDAQPDQFDNAWQNLLSGNFQEWQLGVQFNMPIGYRKAHAAVRNAQLFLARERAMLDEQEREVAHDLSSAVADMERAYAVAQTNYNRSLAARENLAALNVKFDRVEPNDVARMLDLLLDAQRRLAEAESRYFRSLAEYEMAVKNVHYQKGSLLDYNEVFLSEGAWPAKAYDDAAKKARRRGRPWELGNFAFSRRPPVISQGFYGAASPDGAEPGSPSIAKADQAPAGGFDHEPGGGVQQVRSADTRAPAPREAARPVRLVPDASLESPAISPESSVPGNRRAATGKTPAWATAGFDQPGGAVSGDNEAAAPGDPAEGPARPGGTGESWAIYDNSPTPRRSATVQKASHDSPIRSKPWLLVPFARDPAKAPSAIPMPTYSK
jgi:hypothetical protein